VVDAQTNAGTCLAALRWPTISPRSVHRKAPRSWMSSSCDVLPEAITRDAT